MMIGGPKDAVDHLDPIFAAWRRAWATSPHAGPREAPIRAPSAAISMPARSGAGHFVKMVHNGIEYGLMQAYAEGFDILRNKELRGPARGRALRPEPADIAEVWRRGSVVSSWLLDLGAAALAKDPSSPAFRLCPGFRRGPLDGRGGDRGSGAGRRALRGALTPASARARTIPSARRCCRRCGSASADPVARTAAA
jgi:6-phosphogluconate dehydrogenase